MLNRIRQILAPPVFEGDEAKTRVASVLNTLVLIALVCALVYSFAFPLLTPLSTINLALVLPFFPILIIAFVLIHRGQIRAASFFLTSGTWLELIISAVATGGVRTPAFSGLIMVVLIAGVLLGRRASLGLAGLSMVAGLAMVYAQADGLITEPQPSYTPWVWWFSLGGFFLVAAAVLHLATYSTSESLERAHRELAERKRAEAALRESEQALRTVVANAPVILFALDRNGVYTLSEGKGLTARGIISRQVVGKSAFDLHRDNPKIIGALRNAFSGEACNGIFEVGHLVFDVWYSPIRDQNNAIDGVIGVATDVTESRQAQQALSESGERLQQLAASLQEAIWLRDTRTLEILYVNPAYERIWGRSCESFYKDPTSFVEAIHPEDKERVMRAFQGQYEGQSFSEEYRIIRPDGTIRWIFGRTYPIKNEAGETIRITAIAEDITERKRGEQALQESEDRFRSFVEHTSEWILMTDEQGSIVEWNPGAEQITGLGREAVVGKPVWDVQYQLVSGDHKGPSMYERLKSTVQDSLRTGTSPIMNRVVEAQFRRADGVVRFAEQRLFPITTAQGFRLSGISRDITERKQAEQALKENEQKFRSFIEQASDAFMLVDEQCNIIEWNQGAERIWGLKHDQVVGKPFWDVQFSATLPERRSPERLEQLKAAALDALRTGESNLFNRPIEAESCGSDGKRKFIQQTMFPIKTDKGYRIGSVTRDITENKQSEDALRKSEEWYRLLFENMLDGFAYCKMLYDEQDRPMDFVYLDVNDAFERLAGLKDVVGRQVTEVVPGIKESNPELFEIYGRVALTGKPERFELNFKALKQWLSISVYSSEKGYFIALFDNITERKQAEQELRESEERYRQLVELTPDAIFVHAEKRFVLANPASVLLFGAAQPQDLIGQPILERIHPEYRGIVLERIRQTVEERRQTPLIEQKYLRMDGTAVDVETIATPFVYEGKPAAQVVARDITGRKRAEEQTRLQLRRLNALHVIDVAITGNLDLRVILSIVLEQATAQLSVDAAAVLLLNAPMQTLDYIAGRGFRFRTIEKTHLRLSESYAGRAVRERSTVHFQEQISTGDSTPFSAAWANEGFVSYCGVPLISKGQVQGVLELFHRAPLEPDPEWSAFLETLATQTAIAIDNTTLFNDLQHSNLELTLAYDTTLEGWSRALDLRDKETEGHSQRLVDLTLRLAQKLRIGDNILVHVRRGALLHDIGKMGIPDSILLKPGPLTKEEWAIMRKHPAYAYDLISPIAFLRPALDIPYCHHERWDGSGYPRALKGVEIPLIARAFAVVDVWDALCSDRPYRLAWSKDQVYDYLRAEAGKQFDAQIVSMFLGIMGNERSA